MSTIKIATKSQVNLVEFQEKLNEEFLTIYKESLTDKKTDLSVSSDMLGLLVESGGLHWFFPLKNLQHIAALPYFEEIYFTKSFVKGFTQYRDNVFLVIDWQNLLNNNRSPLNKNSVLVHFNSYFEQNLAFLIDNLNLEYTAEYTKLFISKNNMLLDEAVDLRLDWRINPEISNLFDFIKKDNLNPLQATLLETLNSGEYKKYFNDTLELNNFISSINNEITIDINNPVFINMLLFLIDDVYLDGYGKHPIFTFSTRRFSKLIESIKPY